MASVAEFEGRRISAVTRETLAAAKARGVKLGGTRPGTITENAAAKARTTAEAEKLRAMLVPMAAVGLSLRAMGQALAGAGTMTRTCAPLGPSSVARLLERLELHTAAS